MMALGDCTESERLRTRIGILENAGQHGIADRLRDELAELERRGSSDCAGSLCDESLREEAPCHGPDEPCLTTTLSAFRRQKRTLVRLGIVDLEDFQHWNVRRFRLCRVPQRDIELIYATMAALEMSVVIGSADVPMEVPEPNPYAIDLLDGRTETDVCRLLDGMARGELTQRQASIQAGTSEEEKEYGYAHQRAGSILDRHNCYYAGACLRAIKDEYKHAMWLKAASIEKLACVKKRPWALKIELRCTVEEAAKLLRIVPNKVHGGFSWRGCRVLFVEVR